MRFVRRRGHPALPDDAARDLGIEGGERVLAWSPLVGGGVAAATRARLYVRTPQGHVVARPWTEVDHAVWEAESSALAVWWVGSRQATPLEIEDQSRLPDVVHERVRSSVLLSAEVPLPGGRSVWVALRKAADGTITRQVAPRPGVRLDDEDVEAAVRRALDDLSEQAGDGAR